MNARTPKNFIENIDGVHLQGPFSDYTLCGDTMDGDRLVSIDPPRSTYKKIVTCEKCIKIILLCKNVRVAKNNERITP